MKSASEIAASIVAAMDGHTRARLSLLSLLELWGYTGPMSRMPHWMLEKVRNELELQDLTIVEVPNRGYGIVRISSLGGAPTLLPLN